MSNRLYIQPTIFEDYPSGTKTYGVRVFDDYTQAYVNTWRKMPKDDMAVLLETLECSDQTICDLMSDIQERHRGLYIGTRWYQWDEIEEYFKE